MGIDATQAAILEAIRDRLRSALQLPANRCYISLTPLSPAVPRGGSWWLVVTPGEGVYDTGEQSAGQCSEYSRLLVTVFCRLARDRSDEDEQLLLDETAGLMQAEQQVLAALIGHDLALPDGGKPLRNLLYGVRSFPPQVLALASAARGLGRDEVGQFLGRSSPRQFLGSAQLEFGADFDWDLS